MAKEKLFWVGIKGLIENKKGQILLLQSSLKGHTVPSPKYWDIPGGRIQEGQSVDEALRREIEEETGITKLLSVDFFTGVISNHQIPFEGTTLGLVLMVYRVRVPEDSRITLSDEHIASEWVDKKEAAGRLAHKYPKDFTQLLLTSN